MHIIFFLSLSLFLSFGLVFNASTVAEQTIGITQPSHSLANIVPAIKIDVTKTGKIIVDKKELSLESLKLKLVRLKEKGGVVFYYRENPEKEPPEKALAVMSLIVEQQLPIKLCQLQDCSK